MAITFPSKSQKKISLLVDALRIMAWEEFRATNKDDLKGLEFGGYSVFADEWKDEEIHNFTCSELEDFIKGLEYSVNELLNYRSEYYAKKKTNNSKSENSSKSAKFSYTDEDVAF